MTSKNGLNLVTVYGSPFTAFPPPNPARFPAGSLARDLFDLISGVVNDLESSAATESGRRGAARQGTATLAAWLGAKRIERAPRRNNKNSNINTAPAPQTPNS